MNKILLSILVIVTACLFINPVIYAEENGPVETLPPIIAQMNGPASTIIMWHDIDEDGNPDYKATYAFINGRLHLLEKNPPSTGDPVAKKSFVN